MVSLLSKSSIYILLNYGPGELTLQKIATGTGNPTLFNFQSPADFLNAWDLTPTGNRPS